MLSFNWFVDWAHNAAAAWAQLFNAVCAVAAPSQPTLGRPMDLDELAFTIRQTSTDPVALKLSELLLKWKSDESNVKELESVVERYIGNTWIVSTKEHEEIYRLWSKFRNDAVRGIGGMTINERLYFFSLISRFDGSKSDEEREVLYAKLLAHP